MKKSEPVLTVICPTCHGGGRIPATACQCEACRDTRRRLAPRKVTREWVALLKQAAYLLDYFHDRGEQYYEDAAHVWFMEYHKALSELGIEVEEERHDHI